MKSLLLVFFTVLMFSVFSFAQVPAPSPAPSASPAAVAPAPIAAPAIAKDAVLPAGSVAVAAPAAPPQWAIDLLMSAQKFPVVGPIVSKAIFYAGIVSSVLTALVAFLFALLSALSGAANLSGLAGLVAKLQSFKDGPIMYWLQYFSMFNAQKPVPPSESLPSEQSQKMAA